MLTYLQGTGPGCLGFLMAALAPLLLSEGL